MPCEWADRVDNMVRGRDTVYELGCWYRLVYQQVLSVCISLNRFLCYPGLICSIPRSIIVLLQDSPQRDFVVAVRLLKRLAVEKITACFRNLINKYKRKRFVKNIRPNVVASMKWQNNYK